MTKLVLILGMLGACAGTFGGGPESHHTSLRVVNGTTLALAEATLACDWAITRRNASTGWSAGGWENNPILGQMPSTQKVDAYNAAAAIGILAVSQVVPEKIRWWFNGTVVIVEAVAVQAWHQANGSTCL